MIHIRCRVVLMRSFISALFLYFSGPSLVEMKFYKSLFLIFVLFGRFLNHLPNRRQTGLLCWRRTLLVLEMNMFCTGDKHTSVMERVRNSATLTDSYQRLPDRTYVEMTATHWYSPTKTGSTTLSYSPPSTVGSRLSKRRLSVSGLLDAGSRRHVFGTSEKKTMEFCCRRMEFCCRRKQSCCTNDCPERYAAFSMKYGI